MKFATIATLLATAGLAVAGLNTDSSKVTSDIQAIDTAVSALMTALLQTEGTDYWTALNLLNKASALTDSLKSATKDTNKLTGNILVADGSNMIRILTGTEKNIKSACNRAVAIKSNIDKLGVSGVVKNTFKDIQSNTANFGSALLSYTQPSLVTPASTLLNTINADIAVAVSAYANS